MIKIFVLTMLTFALAIPAFAQSVSLPSRYQDACRGSDINQNSNVRQYCNTLKQNSEKNYEAYVKDFLTTMKTNNNSGNSGGQQFFQRPTTQQTPTIRQAPRQQAAPQKPAQQKTTEPSKSPIVY